MWLDLPKSLTTSSPSLDQIQSLPVSPNCTRPECNLSCPQVVAEPVVGATTGVVPAPKGYFKAIKEIVHKHGALLILDEVMCGMGR